MMFRSHAVLVGGVIKNRKTFDQMSRNECAYALEAARSGEYVGAVPHEQIVEQLTIMLEAPQGCLAGD